MKTAAFPLALLAFFFLGCVNSPERRMARIEAIQEKIDRIGLEEIDVAANFGSLVYTVTRDPETGERVAEFTHKNPVVSRFYFRTRKRPGPGPFPLPEDASEASPAEPEKPAPSAP